MGLFGSGKQSGRERRAMKDHLVELDELRRTQLRDLGEMTVEMAKTGRFDRERLSDQARELVGIDRESDLIAHGLEEGLTLEQLEDLARSDERPAADPGK
ncbi:MAG: hypothetical protein WD181_05080 [Solirubrobacterales bacterium]